MSRLGGCSVAAAESTQAMPIAPELALNVARRLPSDQWDLPRHELEVYVSALREAAQRTGHLGDDTARGELELGRGRALKQHRQDLQNFGLHTDTT